MAQDNIENFPLSPMAMPESAIRAAIVRAKERGNRQRLFLEGFELLVAADSNPADIVIAYDQAVLGFRSMNDTIGPHPTPLDTENQAKYEQCVATKNGQRRNGTNPRRHRAG